MQKLILRGSATHLSKLGLFNIGLLPYLMLNMPFLCNYRCLKCCNLKINSQTKSNYEQMSLTDIQTLLEEAGDSGFKVLVFAGEGEPLLNKQFRDIIAFAIRNGLLPYIFTNGTMLNQENINFLAEHKASLIISLDSLTPVRYARLTAKNGSLERLLSNIQLCRSVYSSLQEQTSFGKVVSLAINTVVTRINVDEIDNIRRFCADDIVFVCNRPTRTGLAEKNWTLLYGSSFDDLEIDAIIERHSKTNGPLGSTLDGQWCAYMKHGVSVGYEGSFLACAYATDTAGLFGTYKKGMLKQANNLVMDSINYFYMQNGRCRCILRHPSYHDWISSNRSISLLQA